MTNYFKEVIENNKDFLNDIIKSIENLDVKKPDFNYLMEHLLIIDLINEFNKNKIVENKLKIEYGIHSLIIKTGINEGISEFELSINGNYNEPINDLGYHFKIDKIIINRKLEKSPLNIRITFSTKSSKLDFLFEGKTVSSSFSNNIIFYEDNTICEAYHPKIFNIKKYKNDEIFISTVEHLKSLEKLFEYNKEKALKLAFSSDSKTQEEVELMLITEDLNLNGFNFKNLNIDVLSIENGIFKDFKIKNKNKIKTKK